jgi:DNA polymerase III sliding clamp (beta) subunit (PCNA family)
MKIDKHILLEALETVKPGLGKNDSIEQSTSFCFVEGGVVTYNDELSIFCPVPNLDLEGAVNSIELHAFVNKAKSEEIELSIEDNELLLKSAKSKAGLKIEAEVVLPVDEIGEVGKFKKLPKNFLKALNFTMGACSRDNTKPVLMCVNVTPDRLESSDNYRIAHYDLEESVKVEPFLLHANLCSQVVKFSPVKLAKGDGWIHFINEAKAVMSCRIFEEDFPDASGAMKVKGNSLKFPKNTLSILERAAPFFKRDKAMDEFIQLSLADNKLTIKSESASGWFKESSKTEYTGEPIDFGVTPYLLRDILKQTNEASIDGKKLIFQGTNWKYLSLLRG